MTRTVWVLASVSLLFSYSCVQPIQKPELNKEGKSAPNKALGYENSNSGETQETSRGNDAKGSSDQPSGNADNKKPVEQNTSDDSASNGKDGTPKTPAVSAPLPQELMALSSQSTKSNKTPMGRWFNDVVDYQPTAEELALLSDPNKDIPIDANHKDWVYKPFQVNLYPSGGKPHPADGGQRGIGDCNMLAMLNSFAYQYPDFLKSIIKEKGNGVFEISMFDPKAKPIKVVVGSNFLADKNGQLTAVAGKNNSANWITVLEKAIMKYNQVYKVWKGNGPARVEGFGSEAGAPMLTGEGNSYAFDRGALKKPEDLTRVVKEALKAGKLITGGFGVPMELNGLKSVTGHAYTVLVPQDNGTMMSMRNPWGFSPKAAGGGDNSKDGILDIPFQMDWFKTIDIRVMEPGIAGTQGQTEPYKPRPNFAFTASGHDAYETQIFLKFHPELNH